MTETLTWLDAVATTGGLIIGFLTSPSMVLVYLLVGAILAGIGGAYMFEEGRGWASVLLWLLCVLLAYLLISTIVFLDGYGGDGLSWTP